MSNWPLIAACGYQVMGAGTGTGTTVTSSGSANAKGSYATIGTTSFETNALLLSLTTQGTSRQYRIDIAVNTGGADTIVVADWFISSSAANTPYWIELPIAIPSGATVKMRCQANAATQTISAIITAVATGLRGAPGARGILSATDWTNTLPTNSVAQTGNTYTAWTTIMAATAARFSRLWASLSDAADGTRTASDVIVDIGIGAAASEHVLASFLTGQGTSKNLGLTPFSFQCDIPSGSRLAFRAQCSNNAAADSMSVACMGLAA